MRREWAPPKQAIPRDEVLAQELEDREGGPPPVVIDLRHVTEVRICGKAHPLLPSEVCMRLVDETGVHPGIHDSSPQDASRGEAWRDDV